MSEWNGWKVWLHPLRARDELQELLADLEEVREELDRLRSELSGRDADSEQLRGEVATLRAELDRGREERERLEDGKARLQREVAELREDIADRKSTEEQISIFEEKLKGVEAMKANYEKQISRLSGRICDLQAALNDGEPSELEEIDMRTGEIVNERPRRKGRIAELDRPENNWLEPLPEL